MASALDTKLTLTSEDLLFSQMVSQEAIIRWLMEKGIFSKKEFLKMVKEVELQMKKMV